jgi:hypothetical protein
MKTFAYQWDNVAMERSIAHFCKVWEIDDTARTFGDLRSFVHGLQNSVIAARPHSNLRDDQLTSDDCQQTLSALMKQAKEHGYSTEDIATIEECYWISARLTVGCFRPCGRPYINHLVGIASLLVHNRVEVRVVASALLYSSAMQFSPEGKSPSEHWQMVSQAIGKQPITDLVAQVPHSLTHWRALTLGEWEVEATQLQVEALFVFCVAQLEPKLSGEEDVTEIRNLLPAWLQEPLHQICELYRVAGLFAQFTFDDGLASNRMTKPASFKINQERFEPMFAADLS